MITQEEREGWAIQDCECFHRCHSSSLDIGVDYLAQFKINWVSTIGLPSSLEGMCS